MIDIITHPRVRIVSVPRFMPDDRYVLPQHGDFATEAEQIMAMGGKVCYDSYGPEGRPVVEHVEGFVSGGHYSVAEHAVVGLLITGVSRGLSHEVVRHRVGFAYSQRSTRYTKEDGAAFVLDPFYAKHYDKTLDVRQQSLFVERFIVACQRQLQAYKEQIEDLMTMAPPGRSKTEQRKWARGKARQVLPHALETRFLMTGNIRAWRDFILKRSGAGAEEEVRRLAQEVYIAVHAIAPHAFHDFRSRMFEDFPEFYLERDASITWS